MVAHRPLIARPNFTLASRLATTAILNLLISLIPNHINHPVPLQFTRRLIPTIPHLPIAPIPILTFHSLPFIHLPIILLPHPRITIHLLIIHFLSMNRSLLSYHFLPMLQKRLHPFLMELS